MKLLEVRNGFISRNVDIYRNAFSDAHDEHKKIKLKKLNDDVSLVGADQVATPALIIFNGPLHYIKGVARVRTLVVSNDTDIVSMPFEGHVEDGALPAGKNLAKTINALHTSGDTRILIKLTKKDLDIYKQNHTKPPMKLGMIDYLAGMYDQINVYRMDLDQLNGERGEAPRKVIEEVKKTTTFKFHQRLKIFQQPWTEHRNYRLEYDQNLRQEGNGTLWFKITVERKVKSLDLHGLHDDGDSIYAPKKTEVWKRFDADHEYGITYDGRIIKRGFNRNDVLYRHGKPRSYDRKKMYEELLDKLYDMLVHAKRYYP